MVNVFSQAMNWLNGGVVWANGKLWDIILIVLLCGTGIFFTVRLKFIQVRKLPEGFKQTFSGLTLKGKVAGKDGMSSFQSLATSIAGQVGTGNLAGVATAMVSGGAGAIFWMWVSAFFGMATIYAEAVLGQKYKKVVDGEVVGGPVYYIQAAVKGKFGKFLAGTFAVLIIFALGFMGNMVQSNSIGDAVNTAFNVPPILTGIVLAIVCLLVFLGGRKRIASIAEKVVPIMAIFFVLTGLFVVFKNYNMIIPSLKQIFVGAFAPQAVVGGILGVSVKEAVRFGVARGLFSNEAGMGSTPHAHAIAKVENPCQQGLVSMVGIVIDTFIVIPTTVMIIMTTGALGTMDANGNYLTGIQLTQDAFTKGIGSVGNILVAVSVLFFAFTTIIGWYFFGQTNFKYLFGKKAVPIYSILVAIFVVIGSALKVDFVWNLSDLFNGLMVIPNLIGVIMLNGVVVKLTRSYEKDLKDKKLDSRKKS